ncbi:hypothetical protein [Algoriphagus pacificus]|uniref:PH domain-containing protein n=1 Tax=Algoriphagus pacificus TaxID=2811234 RepID=A0ABS3CP19_9BACT|nr:hypothetical protein [Algoriphagus pacificus]MBN7817990.1 hypothetical protein [Algoriphagus pacificus]
MESHKTSYTLFKFAPLGIGIIILTSAIISYFYPHLIIMNGEPMEKDLFITLIFALIGIFFLILFFAIKDKFVWVKMGDQTIEINSGSIKEKVNWLDVESISQIQFVSPPLYSIKLKGKETTHWFNTSNHFMQAGGFTKDMSDMGSFIKKKKRELGI